MDAELETQIRKLFANLAAGSIYTRDTVYRIRQIGLLTLAGVVLQVLVSMLSHLLLREGVYSAAAIVRDSAASGGLLFGSAQLPGLSTAGLLLLASWIKDVGRKTSDEAEGLRHEAELVV